MTGKLYVQFSNVLTFFIRAIEILCLAGSLVFIPVARAAASPPAPPELPTSRLPDGFLAGWLTVVWGDDKVGGSQTLYTLTDIQGRITRLSLDDSVVKAGGGILGLNHKYVTIQGQPINPSLNQAGKPLWQVNTVALTPIPASASPQESASVSGSKPWVSILCKFSDHAEEPHDLAYFQGMYAATRPGLDHYWQELSYGIINVTGSNAFGWFTLPHPESYYNPTDTSGNTDLYSLADDCTHVADPTVNFANYAGINLMFNTDFANGWAYGGGWYGDLDGLTNQRWSITWEPPWGYANLSVIAHEMGHGFGMPHSSSNYGPVYDNAWDVMSNTWYNCGAAHDPTYGCIPQHTIAYHLADITGWIPAGQIFIAGPGTNTTIILEQLALPQTSNYKMVRIPIDGSPTHFYTVEVRRQVGYDSKLPGNAVIIHEVDIYRDSPAHVIDADGNGNTGDAGAMWTVGETFIDGPNGISVDVSAATASGFQVRITTPAHVWTISGHVVAPWGAGLSGIKMAGLPNNPITDGRGYYSDQVVEGWSGTVTPQRVGFTFSPPSIIYSNVVSDQTDQDYPETYHKIMYVKPAASGSGACTSWANACGLQTALAMATGGEEVWVSAGIYRPSSGSDRTATFSLDADTALFGGFNGTETTRDQRNPAVYQTILSGDIGEPGNISDNSKHVITGAMSAYLDGFTITSGNADDGCGGGMYAIIADLSISNIIFKNNSANYGGGLCNYDSNISMTNVVFSNNSATTQDGGGLLTEGSEVTLENVSFDHNTAASYGGGMSNWGTNATLDAVTFYGNHAGQYGGGMLNGYSMPTLTNVTFVSNDAGYYGGGMSQWYGGHPTLNNVTFSSNSAGAFGGGIHNDSGSMDIRNTILWNNTAYGYPQIYNSSSTSSVSDSIIQGGYTGGTNVITTDPNLGVLGDYGGFTQTIPIQAGSSAIDAANITYCPPADQRGVTRPQGSLCDIGAYERDLTPPMVVSSVLANSDPAHTPHVVFTVTFSEFVTSVDPTDFSLTVTGATGAFVSMVDGSGNTYHVVVYAGSGDGTIRLDVPPTASVTNMDGTLLTGLPFTSGQTYTIEKYDYGIYLPYVKH